MKKALLYIAFYTLAPVLMLAGLLGVLALGYWFETIDIIGGLLL